MDFKRFGRLNTKKLNEYLDEVKNDPNLTILDMSRLFPRLSTRKATKENRHIINNFNTMLKSYRYCYKLFPECIAEVKRKGDTDYQKCYEIDNDLYVFTNETNIDDSDCELIFDRDRKVFIKTIQNDYDDLDIVSDVLNQMKKRRVLEEQIEALEYLISHVSYLELNYESLPKGLDKYPDKGVFTEFMWRIILYNTDIYQKDYEANRLELKKVKIEDGYSILKYINSYGMLDWLFDEMENFEYEYEKLKEYELFNHTYSINKLASVIRENHRLEFWFDEFAREGSFKSILEDKINEIQKFLEVYSFLKDHRSKQYRHLFEKYNRFLTNWQTQQVFRKYKQEYEATKKQLEELYSKFEDIQKYENQFNKIDKLYKDNLGANGIPNNGFGYIGDGLEFGDDKIVIEMRANTKQELDNERQERIDYYNEKERIGQEAYEEEQQKLYNMYSKLEILYNDNEPIFELLKQYYDLDFSDMNPDDEDLEKVYRLVLGIAPHDQEWYLNYLIKENEKYKTMDFESFVELLWDGI